MSRMLSVKSRYAIILILLGLMALMEARHPSTYFRLATFILAFLALAGMASLLRGKLRDGFVVLASLALGLSIVEATATVLESRDLLVTNGLFASQPIIGWGPAHAGRFHTEKTDSKSGALIYRADYTIDSNLLRETRSAETGPAIVFFGDSFIFGMGLNDADTLPQVFADLLGRKQRVLNLGFPAYAPQQFLAELQTGRFDGVIGAQPRLFIFTTMPEHAERTACKSPWVRSGPRYVLENGQVALMGACYEGLRLRLREWLENMASYRFFIEPYLQRATHDDVDLWIRILVAAVNLAHEKYGVATLINYIPDHGFLEGTGFSDDEIVQRLRDSGCTVVDVSLAQEEAADATIRIKGDGHPT
ncbi:MAG: SGNH/GDSL hydrolase family protein, partial [Methylocella sp.]